jgi:hypothetical protein
LTKLFKGVKVMLINNKKYTYELRKVKSNNDEFSLVYVGYSAIGVCDLIKTPYGVCVRVNTGRFSDFLHTSPIVNWVKKNNKYIITTLNSVYELMEIPNGKKETSKKNSKINK